MSTTEVRLKIVREVAEEADRFYGEAEKLGKLAADRFTRRHRKQVTDLENVANSALKVTDVFNHIKNQTARRDWNDFGDRLLQVVETDLKKRTEDICGRLPQVEDKHKRAKQEQHVHLQLMREFIRQLAAQYEYQCLLNERA